MNAADLQRRSVDELRHLAVEHGIADAARLDKRALVEALLALAERAIGEAAATVPVPAAPGAPARTGGGRHATVDSRERERERERKAGVDGHAAAPADGHHHDEPHGGREHPTRYGVPSSVLPPRPPELSSEAMARMYFDQGMFERAAELYRELLVAFPNDRDLAARLEEAEHAAEPQRRRREEAANAAVRPPAPVHTEPFGMLDFEELPEAYDIDEVELLVRDPHLVFAYWEVSESGMASARSTLGPDGSDARLVLRLFAAVGSDGDRITRDVTVDGWRGRRYFASPRSGAQLRAAVGLVATSGLFAPIAHSSALRVPPAEPAPYNPGLLEWFEVKPSGGRAAAPEKIEILRRLTGRDAPRVAPLLPSGVFGPRPPGLEAWDPAAVGLVAPRDGGPSSPSASGRPGSHVYPPRSGDGSSGRSGGGRSGGGKSGGVA